MSKNYERRENNGYMVVKNKETFLKMKTKNLLTLKRVTMEH